MSNRKSVTIITENSEERQLIHCGICEYFEKIENGIDYCHFCKNTQTEILPNRVHVPEIRITRMNKRIKELFGGPIYTQC